jgi:hypothetical protein
MNKRALFFGLLYCGLVVAFKLVILLGGYTLTKFGFYYSNITAVLFIIPFFIMAVGQVRDKDHGGVISGRDAARIAITVLAVAVVVLSIYHFIEFKLSYHDIATQYYQSEEYLDILKVQQAQHPDKIKTTDFPRIIEEQISSLSAFKATTGKLVPLLFIGFSGAFITAVFMKRNAVR